MSVFAHIISADGGALSVAELFSPPPGATIGECFHPSMVWVDVSTITPAPQPGWSASETAGVWTFAPPVAANVDTRIAARAALERSDLTILRCLEHGVSVPSEWAAYRASLRSMIAGPLTSAPLPTMPAFPAGT